MKFITLAAKSVLTGLLLICAAVSTKVYSDELNLGLWTDHIKDRPEHKQPYNEVNKLVAYKWSEGYYFGAYENSHYDLSFLAGTSLYNKKFSESYLTLDMALASGYPERMHKVGNLVVIPSLTITHYFTENLGVSYIHIPTMLSGVGFRLKF